MGLTVGFSLGHYGKIVGSEKLNKHIGSNPKFKQKFIHSIQTQPKQAKAPKQDMYIRIVDSLMDEYSNLILQIMQCIEMTYT